MINTSISEQSKKIIFKSAKDVGLYTAVSQSDTVNNIIKESISQGISNSIAIVWMGFMTVRYLNEEYNLHNKFNDDLILISDNSVIENEFKEIVSELKNEIPNSLLQKNKK